MRVVGVSIFIAFGASSAFAVDEGSRKSLLSSEYAASTTMAPRKVPAKLYKPIDSFGSKVELHADDEKSKGGRKDKAAEGDKADVEKAEKAESVEKAKESEKSEQEATKTEKADVEQKSKETEKSEKADKADVEKAEKAEETEKSEQEATKTEEKGEEVEPAGTPAPADTVPPAPAPKHAVGQGIQYDEAEYQDDWHTEWSHGDYPSYKETHNAAEKIEQYEDRQSDGKASPPGGMYAKKDKEKKKD